MANPTKIVTFYEDKTASEGFTLNVWLRKKSNGNVYEGNTDAGGDENWHAWVNADVLKYSMPFTWYGGKLYIRPFPTVNVPVDDYIIEITLQAGGSPAITDAMLGGALTPLETVLMTDGLDNVNATEPPADIGSWNFRQKLLWLYNRFAYKHTCKNDDFLKTHQADGTELTKQTTSEVSGLQTVEKIQTP